ncbi:hypothetical protein RHSIM_Rhsim01G0094000 [Rhododendron simsii]|uniref:TMS membrane family protein n=1 Tax=Rhododendron simsii TaxID=118357 RepID=A0A834LV34_RHOSS|nr:hypothetical protein RHSIM_Rhsim01G0094000 [Rhododendron simsii]
MRKWRMAQQTAPLTGMPRSRRALGSISSGMAPTHGWLDMLKQNIFYSIMFLSTVGTSKLNVGRELWHSGWWSAKILLMIGLTVVPFFVPSTVIRLYGDVAHFGAGVFLVIQLISIISFITWLNDCCDPSDKNEDKCEPPDSKCIKKVEAATKSDWLSIISFVIAVLAIVIATFSTGIDSQCFPFTKDVKESDQDDVPYGFGFFHFVFATGAMYFAMLLISWNSHHTTKKWTIDVGWTSTWVRILNELLAACLYAWMLVAPSVWKSRQTAGSV